MNKNYFKNFKKTYVIAEIGVNHNNNIKIAKKLILAAKKAKADAVKFQTFKADDLATPKTPKVLYQKVTTNTKENHYQMLKKLELSEKSHKIIFNFCKKKKIEFISTPYYVNGAKFLKNLGVKIYKTASADLFDYRLHRYIAKTKKPSIISTGMSNLSDIERVLKIYKKYKNPNVAILHCVSNYPCKNESINLNAIKLMKKRFGNNYVYGYSDHSSSSLASVLSISLGSKIIEKHFTLNKNMKGPDHKASITPEELDNLIKKIRNSEKILGSYKKTIQKEEKEMSKISRKSLYFSKNLLAGTKLNESDIIELRPCKGLSTFELPKIVGKRLKKNVKKFDLVNIKKIK